MKKIVITAMALISFTNYAQIASVAITSFVNETNNLSDNIELDSTWVHLTNENHSMDTSFWMHAGPKNRLQLHPGTYQITCTAAGRTIELENVIIKGDRITFIDLLIEPEKKLKFSEKRKRRKRYYNFMY